MNYVEWCVTSRKVGYYAPSVSPHTRRRVTTTELTYSAKLACERKTFVAERTVFRSLAEEASVCLSLALPSVNAIGRAVEEPITPKQVLKQRAARRGGPGLLLSLATILASAASGALVLQRPAPSCTGESYRADTSLRFAVCSHARRFLMSELSARAPKPRRTQKRPGYPRHFVVVAVAAVIGTGFSCASQQKEPTTHADPNSSADPRSVPLSGAAPSYWDPGLTVPPQPVAPPSTSPEEPTSPSPPNNGPFAPPPPPSH